MTTLYKIIDILIVWCLTPFSTLFQLYRGTYPSFPGVRLNGTHSILPKPLAALTHNQSKEWTAVRKECHRNKTLNQETLVK